MNRSDQRDIPGAYIRQLEARNANLENTNKKLTAELHNIYRSRSWKVTAPLRWMTTFLRKRFNRQSIFSFSTPAPVWPPEVKALEKKLLFSPIETTASIPIGIFMHIFYIELAEEMLDLLKYLPENAQLHISTDSEAKQQQLTILCEKYNIINRTQTRVCSNLGWDIAPFLIGFADQILKYPLILKLHAKRSTQLPQETGDAWRQMLLSSLCGNKPRVNAIMHAFSQDPHLGMVCPPTVAHNINDVHFGGNFRRMHQLLDPYGVTVREDTPIDFPVGSMFWCRPQTLAPWLDQHFTYEDFRYTGADERDGSLAHALERLLLFGCGIAGFSWARVPELTDSLTLEEST